MINSFRGKYAFLSNFHPSPLTINWGGLPTGQWYPAIIFPTVEHAFQAYKTLIFEEKVQISKAETPAKAKQLGQKVVLREDWEQRKIEVMESLLYMKFSDPKLRKKLLDTYAEELVEENRHGDKFWGVCGGQGENHLGKLLMKVRLNIFAEIIAMPISQGVGRE